MKSVCIDTHALVWYLTRPRRLGRAAARQLRDAERGRAIVNIPAVVGVELALVAGRVTVGVPEIDALLAAQPAFRLLPLDLDQVREFAALASIAEPFDRMIVAAARASRQPLLTADEAIATSALTQVIWD